MKARVNSDFGSILNMRSNSDVKSEIIDRIEVGEYVEVQRRNKEWSVIKHNGKSGYLMNQFLVFGEKDGR